MAEATGKKRVLFLSSQPFFQWRGSPIRVAFNVQALAELGYEVDLLTLPVGEDRQIPGVRIMRLPNPFGIKRVSIGPSFLKACFDLAMLRQARSLVRRRHYDVVHGVEDAGAVGVSIARRGRCKLVFEKHSDPASYRKGLFRNLVMAAYARVERYTAQRADAVIGTGPGLVEQVRAMPGVTCPAHHIFDIPSSLVEAEPDSVQERKREIQQAKHEVIATFVGSFAVYQGIDLLFDAIAQVAEQSKKVRFVIVGGTDDEIAERKQRLSSRGVADRVSFLGKIPPDELPTTLAASDILLSPRRAGVNTPLKVLDYMKAGGAIVATDSKANRLILDDATAVLTEPTAAPFARGILELTENRDRRTKLGEAAHRLYRETYNFSEFKKRLGECYRQVLEN
jgi:glycosyltransferase involved in cell wall biosynthesis